MFHLIMAVVREARQGQETLLESANRRDVLRCEQILAGGTAVRVDVSVVQIDERCGRRP